MSVFNLTTAYIVTTLLSEVRSGDLSRARETAAAYNGPALTVRQMRMVNHECKRWDCPPIFARVA